MKYEAIRMAIDGLRSPVEIIFNNGLSLAAADEHGLDISLAPDTQLVRISNVGTRSANGKVSSTSGKGTFITDAEQISLMIFVAS